MEAVLNTQGDTVSSTSMEELVAMAQKLVEAGEAVEIAEEAVRLAKETRRKLQEEDIPTMMEELQLTSFKLSTGETIGWKPDVRLEMDNMKKDEAYDWLESHDFGGLIKTIVAVQFGKGELEKAKALLAQLVELGFAEPMLKRDVHYQTMCAFLREQIEKGTDIPLEAIFGAVAIKKATVKFPPRARKIGG